MANLLALLVAATLLVPPQDTAPLPGRLRWVPNPTHVAASASGTTGWVTDPARHLRPATVRAIDSTIFALESGTGVEIAVVVLDSLDGLEPDQAALLLHRRWGVGKRDQNNGIVFLWSPALRRTHVSIGYRLEGVLPDARTGRIQDAHVIPHFRAGRFDEGMLAGVQALAAAAREETGTATGVAAYNPVLGADVADRPRDRRTGFGKGWLFAPIAAAVSAVGAVAWRRRRRRCPACGQKMHRLDEAADDAALSPEERLEESLKSVDYDVWRCPPCGELAVVPHKRWFSGYGRCAHCRRYTARSTTRTITAATQVSTGLAEVTTDCANCKAHDVREKILPRLPAPSSGGSGGGGGGGGSSSGSSFGGGSAGGGGAGRSY